MKKILIGLFTLLILILVGIWYWESKNSSNGVQETIIGQVKKKNSTAVTKSGSEAKNSLFFDKKNQDINASSDVTLVAMINPDGKKVNAVELHFVFNPNLLQLKKITPSDIFSLVLMDSKIDNEKGTASIVVAVPLGQQAAEKDSEVAILDFVSKEQKGQAEVSFTDKSMAAASDFDGNIVEARVSSYINIK